MSFANLQQAVLQEATAKAVAVQARLDGQLATQESRLKKEVTAIEREILEQARADADNQAQQLRQGAVLAARAEVLLAKQAELTAVRAEFLRQLLALDAAQTARLIDRLLALVTEKNGECTAGEHHFAAVKKAAAKKGFTVTDETIPGEGGFIFRSPRMEMNLTLGQLVDQVLIKHRAAIAETLLG